MTPPDPLPCGYCGSVDGLTPPWKPEDEPLTGATLLRTIEVVTDGLINPRLSEVDWDAVAALSGATEYLTNTGVLADVLTELHIAQVGGCSESHKTDADFIAVRYAARLENQ